MDHDTILVVDAGMVRGFAGQLWKTRRPGGFYSATSTAPTGWAIGAAIGLSLAEPTRGIVLLTGDGCMLMHGNELATASRYGLPIHRFQRASWLSSCGSKVTIKLSDIYATCRAHAGIGSHSKAWRKSLRPACVNSRTFWAYASTPACWLPMKTHKGV